MVELPIVKLWYEKTVATPLGSLQGANNIDSSDNDSKDINRISDSGINTDTTGNDTASKNDDEHDDNDMDAAVHGDDFMAAASPDLIVERPIEGAD